MGVEVAHGGRVGRLDELAQLLEGVQFFRSGGPGFDDGFELFELLDDGGRGGLRLIPEPGGRDLGV